jgi:hypothetical protein
MVWSLIKHMNNFCLYILKYPISDLVLTPTTDGSITAFRLNLAIELKLLNSLELNKEGREKGRIHLHR